MKVHLSDNGDVIANCRPAPSHGTYIVHSHNETEVCNPTFSPVPLYSLQTPINSVNPPVVGFEPLKRQKVNFETACRPPVCLSAYLGAGTINGDVTASCVNDKVDAFDESQENKVEYSELTYLNDFSDSVNYAEALYKVKPYRNDLSDLKSHPCTPNGDVSNGTNVVFTFVSEGGVTVNVYDACCNGNCSCSHLIGGEPGQLKPCRFLYLYSLATRKEKTNFPP